MKLVRDKAAVSAQLVKDKTGQILVKQNCLVQIPIRFADIGLAQIGIDTFTYGCFAIILPDGKYAVFSINGMVELNPARLTIVNIDGVDYHQFEFKANQVMIKTSSIVKRDSIMYNVFDEFIFKGKVPWYLDYEDLGKLFDTAKKYANSNIGNNQDAIEFLASMVTRFKRDRATPLRINVNNYKEINSDNVAYVPLSSVFYSMNSTVNRLVGSYFSDGVVSALVKPSEKAGKLEEILRA